MRIIRKVKLVVDVNRFKSMQITLASPNKVRSWSYGEVKNLKQSTTEH